MSQTISRRSRISIVAALALFMSILAASAHAVPFPAPTIISGSAGPDIDGGGYFKTSGSSLVLEVFDGIGASLQLGTRFGFYFRNDSTTLVPVFDVTDQGPSTQSALVDFANGVVFDQDLPPTDPGFIQSVFTPNSSPIGFFIQPLGLSEIFYSDPGLNLGGLDLFGAYQSLNLTGSYYLSFPRLAFPLSEPPIYLGLMSGVMPVREPASLILALSAFGLLRSRGIFCAN